MAHLWFRGVSLEFSSNVSVGLLIVGSVKEPRIGMDRATVKFNRMLLGAKAHEIVNIFNKEHIPFSSPSANQTIEMDGQADVLTLTPTSGVIGPGASCPIEVAFAPKEDKFYNFNVLV